MATVIVSAAGGTRNWSDTATWVGGALPLAGDDIVANATSGDLYVNAINRTCLTINFTNFTNTFRIENGITLTVTGASITLGSGMNYATGTTGVLSTLGNQLAISIAFNGITIPNLTIGKTSVSSTQTVTVSGATPTVQNLITNSANANSSVTLAGTVINVSSSLNINGLGGILGNIINFSGAACTIFSVNTSGTLINGFTVLTGSGLQMLSNIASTGPVIFSGTATLNPNLFTFSIGGTSINSGTVTWYNFTHSSSSTLTLLSNLNISNNLTHGNSTITGAFSVNIGGSLIGSAALNLSIGSTTVINFTGSSGSINSAGFSGTAGAIVNINTSGLFTIGSATQLTTSLSNLTFNLVGTSTAQVFSSAHTLSIGGGVTLNTNNTGSGGSEILWSNLSFGNSQLTLSQPSTFTGNLAVSPTLGIINGAKIFVGGNISAVGQGVQGTSTIEMNGSVNRTITATIIQNSLIINKSGVGTTVTNLSTSLVLGITGRFLTMNTAFSFGSTTVTLGGGTYTINNASSSSFFNLTLANGQTLTLNDPLTISSSLVLNGGATFAGAYGFTCTNFTCTLAASIITLQNINANPLAEYIVNGVLTLIGTLANRITLQAAGRANFTGNIATAVFPTGSTMTVAVLSSGTISTGMTVSQASGIAPTGLLPFVNDRPTIASGSGVTWVLNKSLTTAVTGTPALAAGYKAKFTLTNNGSSSQNVAYVTTQDIDSNAGVTILSFGSNPDTTSVNTALFRTLNWGPLIAPSGSAYFTFVN